MRDVRVGCDAAGMAAAPAHSLLAGDSCTCSDADSPDLVCSCAVSFSRDC
jgi:hypothetical protein